ncbi:protein of unknown function [endosymbiont DhMRE of Dentiscutata heterogama]|uniref:hypothetical protein n=1 Tax=endosymbiont DhMRE of Dentiscutata heterogama TaxID=1609546 RepID=UPI000629D96A|nr:hypothetical protein [endosymbiont DhMRE of Dentiscutata heterogama]CFW92995.1 protein of unknown function [endosymbiont DhMRE of Dentiscutata heterogama]
MTKKERCFKCQRPITREYVLSKKGYSLKNDWEYWTEKEENKGKYICNSCLLDLYYNDKGQYLQEVKNEKRRRVFRVYIYSKIIS